MLHYLKLYSLIMLTFGCAPTENVLQHEKFDEGLYLNDNDWADFCKKFPNFISNYSFEFGCVATNTKGYVIGHDGKLYRCWEEIGDITKSVGDVFQGITNWERYSQYVNYFTGVLPQECKQCNVMCLCFANKCPRRLLFPNETPEYNFSCIPENRCLIISYYKNNGISRFSGYYEQS